MSYRATMNGPRPLRPQDIAQMEADEAARSAREAQRAARDEFNLASQIPPDVLAAMIGPGSPSEAQAWKLRYETAKANSLK